MRGVVTDGSGNQFEAPPLKAVEGQPGLYFGEFMAPDAGQYQFHMAPSPDTKSDFTVVEATVELSETAMNAKLMEDLAQQTGGRFFRENGTVCNTRQPRVLGPPSAGCLPRFSSCAAV